MARTIAEIEQDILNAISANSTLAAMNSTSATAIYRLIARVVAGASAVVENLYDLFKVDVAAILATQKPSTVKWYRQMALNFQLGDSLPDGEIYYDNVGVDEDTVTAAKIIAQAAVVEEGTTLVVKVAKSVSGALTPLDSSQKAAFESYINEVKDAGVPISVISANSDHLKLTIDIYYNPQILSPTGTRLDGTNSTPVQSAVDTYLLNLEFNGDFIKSHLVDDLQDVEGVEIPEIRAAEAAADGDPNFVQVDVRYRPYSGFMKVYDPADLTLNFIPYV